MNNEMLKEAKRLFDLGFAIHWIKPRSKAPVKPGWTEPTRDSWNTLLKEYNPAYGVGVKMGEASNFGDGYLANIDVDIKSSLPEHHELALKFIDERFPGLRKSAPIVKTSYGFRLFIKTKEPMQSQNLYRSPVDCVVLMPTAPINKRQQDACANGNITQDELDRGYRVRPAWEVDLMSIGKQVVLPPSIHPETGKLYSWSRPVVSAESIPLVTVNLGADKQQERGRPKGSHLKDDFMPETVSIIDSKLSDRIVGMILSGTDVSDRSAACMSVAMAMLKAGFTENQILSVLTDRTTFLGETAYDHRKTNSRRNAADWVQKYCIDKAASELAAVRAFEDEVTVAPTLEGDEAVAAQTLELVGEVPWQARLDRSGKNGDGPPKCTIANIILVLENAVAEDVFKQDTFAMREFYGVDAPWTGGEAGKPVADIDAIQIKVWLAANYRFEPPVGLVFEAISAIATKNAFHPIRQWFADLEAWDGVSRLDTWLACNFGAKGHPDYLAQVFRKWLVASVTRVFEPGAKFDWMPILQGAQGTGKSSFGSILFGQEAFSDWLPRLDDKDAALGLQGKLCVEFGELDSLRRNEVETIKAFITRQVDNVRPPYGRKQIQSYRQCVFFGTTNHEQYLKDETGNRRFCPVEVGELDFEALCNERDQLWAEALFIYENCLEPHLYLDGAALEFALQTRKDKLVDDDSTLMAEQIRDFFEAQKEAEKTGENSGNFLAQINPAKIYIKDLFGGGGPLAGWRFGIANAKFAAKAIAKLGGEMRIIKGDRIWRIKEFE